MATGADSAAVREQVRAWVAANPRPAATISDVADHIEYVRKVAGVDHIGLGSDFDGMGPVTPVGLEDVSKYPYLFAELIRRGWKDADLKKLAGQNMLRVIRANEATAKRLQAERPPSTKTIQQMDSLPAHWAGRMVRGRPAGRPRRFRPSPGSPRRRRQSANAPPKAIAANANHWIA